MLRNEIQRKTGLTRKSIEYYEEKGLIKPKKMENGYRNYSEKDLWILNQISMLRKVGLSIAEIENYLSSNGNNISTILRRKQRLLALDEKKKEVLKFIAKGESQNIINEKISLIEVEESIYDKLELAFPGYLGQMLFAAYQPFLDEPLENDEKEAFNQYITYLDNLPSLELKSEEKEYIEELTSTFDMEKLKEVNNAKISAVENTEEFVENNKDIISEYENFKNSEDYNNSMIKEIEDKFKNFMLENKYYEIATPLMRKFSKSYDAYYKKLLDANEKYLNMRS